MNDLAAWNVLVIDDEPDNSGVVEYVFRFFEVPVRVANSGAAGLEMIRDERPNIILLDIQMPRMSGWDVLKAIRADAALRGVFVIALTAHVMDGDRERAIRAGFDGYLPKPVSPVKLIDDIKAMMQAESVSVTKSGNSTNQVNAQEARQ
jgi:CheY-like chemotaxis protein